MKKKKKKQIEYEVRITGLSHTEAPSMFGISAYVPRNVCLPNGRLWYGRRQEYAYGPLRVSAVS